MPISHSQSGLPINVLHLINGESFAGIERAVASLVQHHREVNPAMVCLMDGDIARHGLPAVNCRQDLIRMRSRFDMAAAIKLAHHIRAHQVHLIHAHTLRANLVAAAAGRLAHIPVVATLHSPMARDTRDPAKNRRNFWLQRMLIPWTAGYIAVSDRLMREAIACGVHASRIITVRNGIDVASYCGGNRMELRRSLAGVGPDTPLAGTHSWLRPRKGIDIFLRSVPIIMRSIPRAHFIIAGKAESPAYEQELRQLVRSMSATDRVQFLGFRSDIPDILAALDVFVMPSLCGEGSPFALLEAMAASRIVIATRTEGNDEIIQSGSTGILVSPGDPEAIARALIDVLNDTGYQRKLGAGARRAVTERFSVERMTAETEAFYLRILSVRISR